MTPGPPSSSTPSPHRPEAAPRKTFALTGPSVKLDPRTHAVRGDLADVRLAELLFAPHYAQPIACRVCEPASLRASPVGEELTQMAVGDGFELLELAGGHAWGIAVGAGLVGYCDRRSLELA